MYLPRSHSITLLTKRVFLLLGLVIILGAGFGLVEPRLAVHANKNNSLSNFMVFTSDRDGSIQIYKMNVDGSNQTRLTNNSFSDLSPAISPDGSMIAFDRMDTSGGGFVRDIWVMSADGTNQVNVSNSPTSIDHSPDWSPDGSKIVFSSDRDGAGVYVMDTYGANVSKLTSIDLLFASGPKWSPDGQKIVFSAQPPSESQDLFVMDADGSNLARLTNTSAWENTPAWSPGGERLAFTSGTNPGSGDWKLYVIDSDGGGRKALTDSGGYFPCWSPDGTKLASSADWDGNLDIYIISADGSNPINITNTPEHNNRQPVWWEMPIEYDEFIYLPSVSKS